MSRTLGVTALLLLGFATFTHAAEPTVRLLVPAYFYPAGEGLSAWKQLIATSSKAPVVAIVNPDSGPGKRVDDNYSGLFKLAKGSPIRLIGYVTLSYGKRPISAVKADIDSWLYFYPDTQGIFFDEQPSAAELAPGALECFAYARQKFPHGPLVSNPGTPCAREYASSPDGPALCLFEGDKGFDTYRTPEWARMLPADRVVILLYDLPTAAMRKRFQEARDQNAGYVYLTDAAGPMPWGKLPSYWDTELSAAAAR